MNEVDMTETKTSPTARFWVTSWRALRVTGPDSKSWLNGIITCNAEAIGAEVTSWGSLLNKQGKIQADLHVFEGSDGLYVVVAGADVDSVHEALDGYLVMEDAEIEACDLRWVIRYRADDLHRGDALFDRGSAIQSAQFAPLGKAARLFGLPDAELLQLQAAAPLSFCSEEEWVRARVAAGFPEWGSEYGLADNLHAAGLERRTVDWSKGCYLGQEVVCMQEMRGKVRRRLVFLRAAENERNGEIPEAVDLTLDGASVGRVVSTAGSAAFARVEAPHYAPGTELVLTGRAGDSVHVLVTEAV